MKILHVEAGKHLYGGARQVVYLMEGLQKRGIDNLLACPIGSVIAQTGASFAQVHLIKWSHELDLRVIPSLIQLMRSEKIDVVHLHSRRGADSMGLIAAKLAKIPVVLSRRVDNPEGWLAMQLRYPLADHVIAISHGIGDVLLNQGLPPKKLSVVPSAVDPADYAQPSDRSEFLNEFNLPQDALVIGVVAQLIERKGHQYLLDVLPKLKAAHPNLQVLFFGQGALEAQLRDRITSNQLNYVYLTGFRTDLPRWLGCVDVLAHPADAEGLGVSLLQAGSAKVAMVGSRVGGIPEIIIDHETGLLIEPANPTQLYEALNTLLSSSKLRGQLGLAAQEHIERHFSINAMVEGNLSVYHHITRQV